MRRIPLMLLLAACTAGAQDFKPPAAGSKTAPAAPVPLPENEPLEPDLPGEFPDPGPTPRPVAPRTPGMQPDVPPDGRTGPALVPGVRPIPRGNDRTWSDSSQFDVTGGNQEERGAVFAAAREVRRQVLTALGQPDKWSLRVAIVLDSATNHPTSVTPVKFDPAQTPDGFRLLITVLPDHEDFAGKDLRMELVRAVLADLCLRGLEKTNLEGAETPPPDWLMHGTLELMNYRERGKPSEIFADVLKLGHVLSVEDLFAAAPEVMDSVSMSLYRVSCCGLLLMLLDQPAGPKRLSEMLPDVTIPGRDPAAVLARHFPGLNVSPGSMQRWWALQIAVLATPGVEEMLSPQATEKELSAALVLRFPEKEPAGDGKKKKGFLTGIFGSGDEDEKKEEPKKNEGAEKPGEKKPPEVTLQASTSCQLSEFARVLKRSDRKAILLRLGDSLQGVRMHAHPVYRPLIDDYMKLAKNLVEDKKIKDAPAEIERLEKIRKSLLGTMQKAEDYLDWWLATGSEEKSGEFEEALKAARELKRKIPRSDRISRYLDAVEKDYE